MPNQIPFEYFNPMNNFNNQFYPKNNIEERLNEIEKKINELEIKIKNIENKNKYNYETSISML